MQNGLRLSRKSAAVDLRKNACGDTVCDLIETTFPIPPLILNSDYTSAMTMDQSLKVQAGAIKTRNVLTRAERVARLKELDRFDEENNVIGMPKVRVQKVSLKKKKKVKKAEEPEGKKKKK